LHNSSVLLRGEPEFDPTGEEQSQFGKDLARLNSFAGSGTDEGSQPHCCEGGKVKMAKCISRAEF
jgi:hypothetical protein